MNTKKNADISIAEDGDILISVDDIEIRDPKKIKFKITQFGLQIIYDKKVAVDLYISIPELREKIRASEIAWQQGRDEVLLAVVKKSGGGIQLLNNIPFIR